MSESLKPFNQQAEQQTRESQDAVLDSLSGFHRLSENQQRYVRATLYTQQRAERGTDPGSAERIGTFPLEPEAAHTYTWIASNSQHTQTESNPYKLSQEKISQDYCHVAVSDLEQRAAMPGAHPAWRPNESIHEYAALESWIAAVEQTETPPFVLEIWNGAFEEEFSLYRIHTTLYLGKDDSGECMVWEKKGYHLPFQFIPLREVYTSLSHYNRWRLRPLAV